MSVDAWKTFEAIYRLAEKHPELMPYVKRAFTSAYEAQDARKKMFLKAAEILSLVEGERRLREGEGGGA